MHQLFAGYAADLASLMPERYAAALARSLVESGWLDAFIPGRFGGSALRLAPASDPRQAKPLIESVLPEEAGVCWERRVVEAPSASRVEGLGSLAVDRHMLDEALRRSAVIVLACGSNQV